MNDQAPRDSIQQSVLARIEAGRVKRRSRAYFALRMAATIALALVLLAVSSLAVSLILFSLHESGEQVLLGFGLRGVAVFLQLFPWFYLALTLVLLVALEWLVRGFRWGYRISVLGIFAALFAAALLAGAAVSATPLHGTLFHKEQEHDLPAPVGSLYEHVLDPHDDHGVFRGIVTGVGTSTVTMVHDDADRDHDDGAYHVFMPAGWDPSSTRVGDRMLVFGYAEPDGIEAEHYQVLPPL